MPSLIRLKDFFIKIVLFLHNVFDGYFFPLNVWIRQKQEPNGYFLILVTQVISEGQVGGVGGYN